MMGGPFGGERRGNLSLTLSLVAAATGGDLPRFGGLPINYRCYPGA